MLMLHGASSMTPIVDTFYLVAGQYFDVSPKRSTCAYELRHARVIWLTFSIHALRVTTGALIKKLLGTLAPYWFLQFHIPIRTEVFLK